MPDGTISNSPFNTVPSVKHVASQADEVESGLKEGVIETLPELSLDIDETELAQNIDKALNAAHSLHDDIKRVQDVNENYWLGHQVKRRYSEGRKVRPIENRQFFSLETLIPLTTDRPPEPVVFSEDKDVSFARAAEKVLVGKYQEDDTEAVFGEAVRHWGLSRLGVIKVVYDVETNDFKTINVRAQRLVLANRGVKSTDIPYIGELVEDTYADLIEKFPKKEEEINNFVFARAQVAEQIHPDTPITYWEFWTNEFVAWKLGDSILDSAVNPLYDFENPDMNFLAHPRKPYFFLNRILSLGKTGYDDTSYSEQTKGVQDAINKINFAVTDDLADRGTLVMSGDGISKANARKYSGGTNERLWVSKGRPGDVVDRLASKQINPATLAYKQDLANTSDDIWGTHGTTRGERGQSETATGRQLLKEGDTGRTQPISKALHRMAREVYEMQLQIIKLYWDEEKLTPFTDQKGGLSELIKFSGRSIKEGMRLRIVPGSMLPLDKFVQRNEAMELAGQGKIDDASLYEKLGWPKPLEAAKKLYLWQRVQEGALPPDVIYPGITQEIGQAMAQSDQVAQRMAGEPNVQDEVEGEEGGVVDQAQGVVDGAQAEQPNPDELAATLQENLAAIA